MLGNIFGSAAAPNFSLSNTYLQTLGDIGAGLGQQAGEAGKQLGLYNTNDANALNAYSNYLTSDPGTEQGNAGIIANAERGASEAGQRAQANLAQTLARRGIAPNSSIGAGALTDIQQGLASNDANNQINLGLYRTNQRAQNLATNANLWNDASRNAFNQDYSLNNQRIGLDSSLYNNALQQELDQYNIDQSNDAQKNALWGAVGTAASAIPGIGTLGKLGIGLLTGR